MPAHTHASLRGAVRAWKGPVGVALIAASLLAASVAFARASTGPAPAPIGPLTVPDVAGAGPRPFVPAGAAGLGAQGRMIVTPSDPTVVPNHGIRTNITAFGYLPLGPDSSYQIAVEQVIGGYEAVFGIFVNAPLGPVTFFDVFTNQTEQSVHLAYGSAPVAGGSPYDFELSSAGGNVWTLLVNGRPFGGSPNASSFDFGTPTATWSGGIGFSEVALFQNSTDIPTLVTVTTVFAFLESSAWYVPSGATATFSGQGGRPWGIEGRAQHGTLAPDEIRSGSAIATVPNGTPLWSGGPVPVRVSLALSATSTVATTPVVATIGVRSLAGPPIPGVPLALISALRAGSVAPPLVTDPNGSAVVSFVTTNVSQTSHDLITARVTIPGYIGATGLGIELTPAAQLSVLFGGTAAVVAPNGSIALSFRAVDPGGHAVGNLLFQFSAGPGGVLASGQARSGADGVVSVEFAAGPVATTVLVLASVIEPGYWGSGSVSVHVVPVAPSFLDRAGPWIALGIVLSVIAVPLAALWSRRRHPPQLPELNLTSGPTTARRPEEPPHRAPAGDGGAGR